MKLEIFGHFPWLTSKTEWDIPFTFDHVKSSHFYSATTANSSNALHVEISRETIVISQDRSAYLLGWNPLTQRVSETWIPLGEFDATIVKVRCGSSVCFVQLASGKLLQLSSDGIRCWSDMIKEASISSTLSQFEYPSHGKRFFFMTADSRLYAVDDYSAKEAKIRFLDLVQMAAPQLAVSQISSEQLMPPVLVYEQGKPGLYSLIDKHFVTFQDLRCDGRFDKLDPFEIIWLAMGKFHSVLVARDPYQPASLELYSCGSHRAQDNTTDFQSTDLEPLELPCADAELESVAVGTRSTLVHAQDNKLYICGTLERWIPSLAVHNKNWSLLKLQANLKWMHASDSCLFMITEKN